MFVSLVLMAKNIIILVINSSEPSENVLVSTGYVSFRIATMYSFLLLPAKKAELWSSCQDHKTTYMAKLII